MIFLAPLNHFFTLRTNRYQMKRILKLSGINGLLFLLSIPNYGQSLISIFPDQGKRNQTLTTTITSSDFYFLTSSAPAPNGFKLQQGASTVFPNWVNVIDDDHVSANWSFGANLPLGYYDLSYTYTGMGSPAVLPGAFQLVDTCKITVIPAVDTIICQNDSAKLSSPAGSSYQWKKNGVNISGATAQVYYAKASGSYKVTVTGGSCPGTIGPVSIYLVKASISPSSTQNLCLGQQVTFNGFIAPGLTYQWKKNGAIIAGATTSTLTVQDSGTYKYILTAVNGCTKSSASVRVNMAILPTKTLTLQPGSGSGKDAFIVSYYPNNNFGSVNDLDAFAWTINAVNANARSLIQFNLSTINPGSDVLSAFLNLYSDSTGSYNLTGHSGDNKGYLRRITAAWNESTVTWSNQPGNTTSGQVDLPVSSSAHQDYLNINVRDLIQLMVDTPSKNYGFLLRLNTEVKFRSLLFSSSDHANSSRRPKLIVRYFKVTVAASNGTTFCNGDSSVLQADTGPYTYQWKKNGTNINGATGSSYHAKTSGTYKVILTGSYGCSLTSDPLTITVNPLPSATVTPNGPTTFCAGDSVILQAGSGAGYGYSWRKNNSVIPGATNISYTAKTAGNYTVKVTDINGCTKLSSVLTVTVPCRQPETGINGTNLQVSVYPNPSDGWYHLDVREPAGELIIFRIYDMTGRMKYEKEFYNSVSGEEFEIHENGIYKMVVIHGNNVRWSTLVKEGNRE